MLKVIGMGRPGGQHDNPWVILIMPCQLAEALAHSPKKLRQPMNP